MRCWFLMGLESASNKAACALKGSVLEVLLERMQAVAIEGILYGCVFFKGTAQSYVFSFGFASKPPPTRIPSEKTLPYGPLSCHCVDLADFVICTRCLPREKLRLSGFCQPTVRLKSPRVHFL